MRRRPGRVREDALLDTLGELDVRLVCSALVRMQDGLVRNRIRKLLRGVRRRADPVWRARRWRLWRQVVQRFLHLVVKRLPTAGHRRRVLIGRVLPARVLACRVWSGRVLPRRVLVGPSEAQVVQSLLSLVRSLGRRGPGGVVLRMLLSRSTKVSSVKSCGRPPTHLGAIARRPYRLKWRPAALSLAPRAVPAPARSRLCGCTRRDAPALPSRRCAAARAGEPSRGNPPRQRRTVGDMDTRSAAQRGSAPRP